MNHLEYEVYTHKSVVEAAKTWCQAQWGARWNALDNRDGTWSVFWAGRARSEHYRWIFETEQQAILFSLRWS